MKPRRVLFVLSNDFGEYVTASIFSRGQPFSADFALPRRLARYAPAGQGNMIEYEEADDLGEIAARLRPDVAVLASGYLFPVNRIATPDALRALIMRLKAAGCAVATTDPWLRIWALRPGSRFTIHSVRKGGVDTDLSAKMQALQAYLEELFRGMPHLFAVPIPAREATWMPFFNPDFSRHAPPLAPSDDSGRDEWLFVLSKEDFIFLAGFDGEDFFRALEARIRELLSLPRNRLRFIGPPEVGRFLQERWPGEPRVEYLPFCDFHAFESALRRASVVAYWNVISSTLLYCLYHRIPPIFFGQGHQAKVCSGLFDHAIEHLYRGRAPQMLDLNAPLAADAGALVERLGIRPWLELIGGAYARLPAPASVIEGMINDHVRQKA